MDKTITRFRVQAGNLLFEVEGPKDTVQKQLDQHRKQIDRILDEQIRLIRQGEAATVTAPGIEPERRRPGRPKKVAGAAPAGRGRRPGRAPVIVRDSSLKLGPRHLKRLVEFLRGLAGSSKLSKDGTVFAIAYYLTQNVLNSDRFSAGDVSMAYAQLPRMPFAPAADEVDVVQMLRNLAATSIGKMWVSRNPDGSFAVTQRGKEAGASGQVVRPRGRRPGAVLNKATKKGRRGRPKGSKNVKKKAARRGRPPKQAAKRGPGRPRKNAI